MSYPFDMQLVVDPFNTSNVVANGQIYIYDPADTTNSNPLVLTDPNGLALTNPLMSNSNGFIPPFKTSVPQVKWAGSGFVGYFDSYVGLRDEALAAKTAAASSASAAVAAAAAAQAPTDSMVDAGIARADLTGKIGAVVPTLVEAQVPTVVTPLVAPLVAQAIANDPSVASSAANMAQSTAGLVPKWKASTAYVAGQMVINPSGDIVIAKVNFTSGTTYSATNWNPSGLSLTIDARGLPQRELVSGEDINNIREPGLYTVASTTIAATLLNWPAKAANGSAVTGSLLVGKAKSGQFTLQEVAGFPITTAPPEHYSRVNRLVANTGWTPWGNRQWVKGLMPDGTNLDTFREPGVWMHPDATKLAGLPSEIIGGEVVLENDVTAKSVISKQEVMSYSGLTFNRMSRSTAGFEGRAWNALHGGDSGGGTTVVLDASLRNSLLVGDWSRQMGGVKKVDTATIALRFDHGLANFNSKCRLPLEADDLPYSLALCSGQWTRAENVGVTPEMVNIWVQGGLAEIWNHSKDHGSGDNSEAAWKAAILDGLTELEAQIPAAAGKIRGFAPPGSTGTNFGGFTNAQTLEQFYSPGGQFILSYHAVVAGYLGNTQRWQDGIIRQGLGHFTADSKSLATMQGEIQSAIAQKRAIQYMIHPSLMDSTGMATSTFTGLLGYIKSEVEAGRLKVVSPYQQLLTTVI